MRELDLEVWRTRPYLADWERRSLRRIFGREVEGAAPRLQDLYRLCQEDDVDIAVLAHKFEGLYAASHGRWFLYDCRAIHQALVQQPGHRTATVEVATRAPLAAPCAGCAKDSDSAGARPDNRRGGRNKSNPRPSAAP